jgi:hypothetical protein
MIVLNDILLVACAITLVTGYVLAAASLHLIGAQGENGLSAARATESPLFCSNALLRTTFVAWTPAHIAL